MFFKTMLVICVFVAFANKCWAGGESNRSSEQICDYFSWFYSDSRKDKEQYKLMLKHGYKIFNKDNINSELECGGDKFYPLQKAIKLLNLDLMEVLLRVGADPNFDYQKVEPPSPLMAVFGTFRYVGESDADQFKMVALLLSYGANAAGQYYMNDMPLFCQSSVSYLTRRINSMENKTNISSSSQRELEKVYSMLRFIVKKYPKDTKKICAHDPIYYFERINVEKFCDTYLKSDFSAVICK